VKNNGKDRAHALRKDKAKKDREGIEAASRKVKKCNAAGWGRSRRAGELSILAARCSGGGQEPRETREPLRHPTTRSPSLVSRKPCR